MNGCFLADLGKINKRQKKNDLMIWNYTVIKMVVKQKLKIKR